MREDLRLRRSERGGVRGKQQIAAVDPVNPAETGDQVPAFDGDPIETEIGEAGIDGARRVMRGEAGETARVLDGSGLPDHGQARPGQRVPVARRAVEQQRDPRIERDVAAVLRQIGQQQKRARIEIGGDQDERRVGRAAHARGQGSALLSAQQPPADSRRIAVRLCFTHPQVSRTGAACVKLRRAAKSVRRDAMCR